MGAMSTKCNMASVSPRFLHHVNIICSKILNQNCVSTIFTKLLDWNFSTKGFPEQISRLSQVTHKWTANISSLLVLM